LQQPLPEHVVMPSSRLEHFGPLVLAGILRSHALGPDDEVISASVGRQWRDLVKVAFKFRALLPPLGYGAGLRFVPYGDTLEFFSGFVLRAPGLVPDGLYCISLPEVVCAVFAHSGPIARLPHTLNAIFTTALPLEGLEPLGGDVPSFILRTRPSFNPLTGFGGVEVLVPVKM
jgi:predicted transcriptional regulator YdeE